MNPITFILRTLYISGNLRKVQPGRYFEDYFGIRFCFDYLRYVEKQDVSIICGNWHGFILFGWQITYLLPDRKSRTRNKVTFP